jgi:hypothetical protein
MSKKTDTTVLSNGVLYDMYRDTSSHDTCRQCDISGGCGTKSFRCRNYGLGIYWVRSKNQKPKEFTLDDVPENAILTCRNGATYTKIGDIFTFYEPHGLPTSVRYLWKIVKEFRPHGFIVNMDKRPSPYDIVSIKEITFGIELLSPQKHKYFVVDSEDEIVKEFESEKELHLIKE